MNFLSIFATVFIFCFHFGESLDFAVFKYIIIFLKHYRPWPMAPKRFTFFQIVGDQALAIDFGQFEGADSEFKCYLSCNPAVFAYFAIFCVFKLKLQG